MNTFLGPSLILDGPDLPWEVLGAKSSQEFCFSFSPIKRMRHRSDVNCCALSIYLYDVNWGFKSIFTYCFRFLQSHSNLQSGFTYVRSQVQCDLLVTICYSIFVTYRINKSQKLTGVFMAIYVKMNYLSLQSLYVFVIYLCPLVPDHGVDFA